LIRGLNKKDAKNKSAMEAAEKLVQQGLVNILFLSCSSESIHNNTTINNPSIPTISTKQIKDPRSKASESNKAKYVAVFVLFDLHLVEYSTLHVLTIYRIESPNLLSISLEQEYALQGLLYELRLQVVCYKTLS